MGYKEIRGRLKTACENLLLPIISLFGRLGVSPDILTITGVLINLVGAYLIFKNRFFFAGLVILFAGIFDILDGCFARKMNMQTEFGGFLDSTMDRVSEGALYLGLLMYYINTGNGTLTVLSYSVMFLSFLISYTRARAGALQINCEEGIFTRTERMVVLILGLVLSWFFDAMLYALIIIGIGSIVTVIQRVYVVHIRSDEPKKKKGKINRNWGNDIS